MIIYRMIVRTEYLRDDRSDQIAHAVPPHERAEFQFTEGWGTSNVAVIWVVKEEGEL